MSNEQQTADESVGLLDFGDYCFIEQKRYGAPNEMYLHKVVGRLNSNSWVDVPVDFARNALTATVHYERGPAEYGLVPVLRCICCGVDETQVVSYREIDCKRVNP